MAFVWNEAPGAARFVQIENTNLSFMSYGQMMHQLRPDVLITIRTL